MNDIVIDIGNSTIDVGIYCADQLKVRFSLLSLTHETMSYYLAKFAEQLTHHGIEPSFRGGLLSSVVPELTIIIQDCLEQLLGCKIILLEPSLKTGLLIKAENQSEVGGDLVALSVAAINNHQVPAIVVGLGTATTICYLDERKALAGVIISVGLKTSVQALIKSASLLSSIKLERPKDILGRNSSEAMKSGLVLGHALMVEGLVREINASYPPAKSVILTGGLANVISPMLRLEHQVNPNLILEGLWIIYKRNR